MYQPCQASAQTGAVAQMLGMDLFPDKCASQLRTMLRTSLHPLYSLHNSRETSFRLLEPHVHS